MDVTAGGMIYDNGYYLSARSRVHETVVFNYGVHRTVESLDACAGQQRSAPVTLPAFISLDYDAPTAFVEALWT